MSLYWQDNLRTLYQGSCREMELPDNSVQCCVTSPPYWGLRKYAGEQDLIWGGNNHHEHEWVSRDVLLHNGRGDAQKGGKYSTQEPVPDIPHSDNTCSFCGAWRGAFGLEPTPDCGRPFMELRKDLKPKQLEYVLSELKKYGLIQ